MSWYKIEFNREQYESGLPEQISEKIYSELKPPFDCSEISVLFRRASSKDVYYTFFFTPKASGLFSALILSFNGQSCEQPPKQFSKTDWTDRIGFVTGDKQYCVELYGTDF